MISWPQNAVQHGGTVHEGYMGAADTHLRSREDSRVQTHN